MKQNNKTRILKEIYLNNGIHVRQMPKNTGQCINPVEDTLIKFKKIMSPRLKQENKNPNRSKRQGIFKCQESKILEHHQGFTSLRPTIEPPRQVRANSWSIQLNRSNKIEISELLQNG
ncbi:MAG: hypothetical protein ACOCUU_02070 [Nanoarchaeota archaeon]